MRKKEEIIYEIMQECIKMSQVTFNDLTAIS